MDEKRILALSSSRVGNGDYLGAPLPLIREMLGERSLEIAFIPFAFVDTDKAPLTSLLKEALSSLPYTLHEVTAANGKAVLENADAIMVSGGNTFKLLHDLYETGLLEVIRGKVNTGTPYIGWSAGANITGATIATTNDMPIIEPRSFAALRFFPFQINPHYYNQETPGFNGETRDQRLTEFVKLNPTVPVVCLPEGTALRYRERQLVFTGEQQGILMRNFDNSLQKSVIDAGDDLSYLLR